jgi:sialic acid synthase SpsE
MITLKIGNKKIGLKHPTYFIADIASNHDGSLIRAKKLIYLAAKNGANAAKFQNFTGQTLISEKGFKKIGKIDHQSEWEGSIYDEYNKCSVPLEWSAELKRECKKNNIEYFTSPYNLNFIDQIDNYVSAWKIGSGDITWHDSVRKIASKKKVTLLATGASSMLEVKLAAKEILKINKKLILMQCNTNYTASLKNFKYVNLNVLKEFKKLYPNLILGLSDHTPGHSTVLGAVAFGARVIEKHFTDDNNRRGPDHKFSMNPFDWSQMVKNTRQLEMSLGDGIKKIEKNEIKTVVVQRRSIRASRNLRKDEIISKDDIVYLRPCTKNGLAPYNNENIIGKKLKTKINFHDEITFKDIK